MTWTIYLLNRAIDLTLSRPATLVGDAWFFDPSDKDKLSGAERMAAQHLSNHYLTNWRGRRPPMMVMLPGKIRFCIDGQCYSNGQWYGGWTTSALGEVEDQAGTVVTAPLLTVSPSINIGGIYHGWIQSGIISDDCEGRRYAEDGSLLR